MAVDTKKAFLMILAAPKDHNVLCLQWFDDVFKNNPDIVKLQLMRVISGVSSSSPPLLAEHYNQALSQEIPPVALRSGEVLTQSMYMYVQWNPS